MKKQCMVNYISLDNITATSSRTETKTKLFFIVNAECPE